MSKGIVRILVTVIVILIIIIVGLVWIFILNPKTEKSENTLEVFETEAINYFYNYNDIYAAKLIVDYYKKDEEKTTISEADYKKALERYKYYYNQYSNKMDLLFNFVKDNNVIGTAQDMADLLDILQDIVISGDDIIYVLDEKDREDLINVHKLISQMNAAKDQKSLDEFKAFYLSKNLNDYESYVIFLRVIYCMPDLLGDTIVTYNNKEIEFSVFLKDSGILDKYLSSVNNFYEKFESE